MNYYTDTQLALGSLCTDVLECIRDHIPHEYDRLAFCKAVGLGPCRVKNSRFIDERPNLVLFVHKCDWFKEHINKFENYNYIYYPNPIINKPWLAVVFKEHKDKLTSKVFRDIRRIDKFDELTIQNIVGIMHEIDIEQYVYMEEKYMPLLKELIPRTKKQSMYIKRCIKWNRIYPKGRDHGRGTVYRAKLYMDYENLERFDLHKCHKAIIKVYDDEYVYLERKYRLKNYKPVYSSGLRVIGELIVKYDVLNHHRVKDLCLFRKFLNKAMNGKDYEVFKYLIEQKPYYYKVYTDSLVYRNLLSTPCKDSRWLYEGLSPYCINLESCIDYYKILLTTPEYLEYLIGIYGPDEFNTTFNNCKRGVLKYNAEHNTPMLGYLLDRYKITEDYKHGVLEGLALNMVDSDDYIQRVFDRLKITVTKADINRRKVYSIVKSFRPLWLLTG